MVLELSSKTEHSLRVIVNTFVDNSIGDASSMNWGIRNVFAAVGKSEEMGTNGKEKVI